MLFHYQRVEALTSNTSDGKPLTDFHREQFGGTVGGPLVKDKAFYFLALEGVRENLLRPNLSEAIGTPCPVSAPTLGANEALINGSADCQRLALLGFFGARGQDEGQPIQHTITNNALLTKLDWNLTPASNLSGSYNFNYSKNNNQTFDVATYGNSANGTEGPSKINVLNLNLFTTVSANRLNELHVTYSHENRPRSASPSTVAADTGMGFVTSFRFGNPFFLGPNVDEAVKRFQLKDNFSIVTGRHTLKAGGEWVHTNNFQVFRGFFKGRYLFDSVTGFLRYASPAAPGGFGPNTVGCANGTFVTAPASCAAGASTGGPLVFYLQSSSPTASPATRRARRHQQRSWRLHSGQWQTGPGLTVDFGLRWDAQLMPETVDLATTVFARFLSDPQTSDARFPDQLAQFSRGQALRGTSRRTEVIARQPGIFYARQNMLSQVGSVTTNGIQQKSDFRDTTFTASHMPVWLNRRAERVRPRHIPDFSGIRVFDCDYQNPRITASTSGSSASWRPAWRRTPT